MKRVLKMLVLAFTMLAFGEASYAANGVLGDKCDDTAEVTGCAEGYSCLRIQRNQPTCYKRCDGNVGGFCSFSQEEGLVACRAEPMAAFGMPEAGACVQVCGGAVPPCAMGMCKPCPGQMQCKPSPNNPAVNTCQ